MSGTRFAPLVAIVVAIAGCGGDESSSEKWTNDVCSNLSEWVGDVDETVKSLTDQGVGLDAAAVRDAFDDTKAATDELAKDLQDLGPPETEAGQQAEQELDALTSEIGRQSDVVERALDAGGEPLQLVATVAGAISASLNQLNETFQSLRGLDPDGELAEAFRSSDDCDSLQEQVADIRS